MILGGKLPGKLGRRQLGRRDTRKSVSFVIYARKVLRRMAAKRAVESGICADRTARDCNKEQ
jgi:hypothetical protein